MTPAEMQSLRHLARLEGVQLEYLDMAGQRQVASPTALTAVLSALGTQIHEPQDIPGLLRSARARRSQQLVEPVIVVWDGKPVAVRVRSGTSGKRPEVRLRLEEGQERVLPLVQNANTGYRPRKGVTATVGVNLVHVPELPLGYHHLIVRNADQETDALLISAPAQSYADPNARKSWGIFVPVYAAHSSSSWGAGNLSDWRNLGEWAGSLGADVMAGLPLLATFLDCPTVEPSPYSPASRLFWNEFYLDIENVPELALSRGAQKLLRSPGFRHRLEAARSSRLIEYQGQMRLRRRVLEQLTATFFSHDSARQRTFRRFLRERPEVAKYARFRAACERFQGSWHTWPERQRNGKLGSADCDQDIVRYYAYTQWLAHEQMQALTTAGKVSNVKFYLDLPLGVHPDSFDVWSHRATFALGANAGAPPDPFFTKGQNWGFAPLHPQRLRESHYRYVLEYLRFQMRHTDLLRIDHVMGLHRLYWIPNGQPAQHGAYVSYPAEEWYALLCLESVRHKTALVGENLGTVPPEVNQIMKRRRLRGMYVLQYEQRPDPREPLPKPSVQSVASLNTHDMPTFAAYLKGKDISDRLDLGLISRREAAKERQNRRKSNSQLVAYLRRKGWLRARNPKTVDVLSACLAWLSAGPAEFLLINLEDLLLEEAPQNVPGTWRERPNWRRKTARNIEQITADPKIRRILEQVHQLRNRTPR